MAFHVACPITCKRICYCPQTKPPETKQTFLTEISFIEDFLKDPWLIRVKEGSTVQVPVPKLALPAPPPPPLPPLQPSLPLSLPPSVAAAAVENKDDAANAAAEELLSAQTKRAALQKKAAVASLAAEDFARRFEAGVLQDAAKDSAVEEEGHANVNVMCRLCFSGENEGSERAKKMLPCRNCGKKYHRTCIKTWSQHRDLFHWSLWTCPSCRICEVCRRAGEPNKFKFCKRCDGAVHCYCMQPPHKNVSSGPYLCPKHTKCHSCDSNVPGNGLSLRWFLGYTCCDACGRLFTKGNYCPVCLKVYRDSESTPMVCCDICQRWVHCQCDGISDERYLQFQIDNNLPYTCPTCRGERYQVRDLEDAVRELWRRRDEADSDLIRSLRAAAGLPTDEEIFSISPFSDDEDYGPSGKSERARAMLSLKNVADFSPVKINESTKKSSSKKHVKKKGLQLPLETKMEANIEGRFDALPSGRRGGDESESLQQPELFSSPNVRSLSSTERTHSSELGAAKEKTLDDIVVSNKSRKPVFQFKSKTPNDIRKNEELEKVPSKPKTMKGPKLVIHLGGRSKPVNDSPRSDSSSYQKEQELTLSGSEAVNQHRTSDLILDRSDSLVNSNDGSRVEALKPRERTIIKLGKGKSQAFGINTKADTGKGLFTPEISHTVSSKRGSEAGATALGRQENVSKGERKSKRKHQQSMSDASDDGNKVDMQPPRVPDASVKDSRPLLRLKFKTPYSGSWAPQSGEERGSVKGQRSKRRRPPPLEKSKHQGELDKLESPDDNLMSEFMEANWVLQKLGRDAIGKRVEVHQPSDNSWHKGVVSDFVEGTTTLSVDLDDGRSKTLELGKHGIRFVPQRQKKL